MPYAPLTYAQQQELREFWNRHTARALRGEVKVQTKNWAALDAIKKWAIEQGIYVPPQPGAISAIQSAASSGGER